jgi:hypothetical protein
MVQEAMPLESLSQDHQQGASTKLSGQRLGPVPVLQAGTGHLWTCGLVGLGTWDWRPRHWTNNNRKGRRLLAW